MQVFVLVNQHRDEHYSSTQIVAAYASKDDAEKAKQRHYELHGCDSDGWTKNGDLERILIFPVNVEGA